MAYYNRRKLLLNTLKSITYHNSGRDIEIIIVDDNSSKKEDITDVPDMFDIPIMVIPIDKHQKKWTYDGIPFNIGFACATGDLIIIQNPENLHVGDIIGYALRNSRKNIFLSFALYSLDQKDTDELYKKAVAKNIFDGEKLKKIINPLKEQKKGWTDGDTCWYNHSIYQPSAHHLISAITRHDLEDLGGFDERYAHGFAYSDFELRERMRKKGMLTKIVDYPFAVHQRHELSAYINNKAEFENNGHMFGNVTMRERGYRAPANIIYCPSVPVSNVGKGTKITKCAITGSGDSIEFINLGDVPLVNNLCETMGDSLNVTKYPLALQLFTESRLTCLTETVNKNELFLDYAYRSGINKPYLAHCKEMYGYLKRHVPLKQGDIVIDVGGNDGSLLNEFKKLDTKPRYINIDASRTFIEINKDLGIEYVNKFFDESFVLGDKTGKKAKLIVSTNVFQHTLPIRSFVKGIEKNLSDDGIWCLEFPYLLTTLLADNYDQIYHEHVFYYLLGNIVELLDQENMKVLDVSFHDIHAGTLRVLSAKKTNKTAPNQSLGSFVSMEKILADEYYVEWGSRTLEKIDKFREFVRDLADKGANIACFGAAAKGCVFLNTCGLGHEEFMFIIDDTPYKQGKYVPGTGLKIVGRDVLKKEKIDYILILAHNFKDYIMDSLKNEYKGRYLIMFPNIKIL